MCTLEHTGMVFVTDAVVPAYSCDVESHPTGHNQLRLCDRLGARLATILALVASAVGRSLMAGAGTLLELYIAHIPLTLAHMMMTSQAFVIAFTRSETRAQVVRNAQFPSLRSSRLPL